MTFAGAVVSNTLAAGYSVQAFLRLHGGYYPYPTNPPNGSPEGTSYAGQQVDITDGGDFILALCDHGANISAHGPWYSSASRVPPTPVYPPGLDQTFSDPGMILQVGFTVSMSEYLS